MARTHRLVVVANRLPVDRQVEPDGTASWRTSPGGLVAALEPVLRRHEGCWIGWTGAPGPAPEGLDEHDLHLVAVELGEGDIEDYYEGMSNGTLWPLYHDVIAPPAFHRRWWEAYAAVNRRFARAAAEQAAPGGTVWIQDYQLQLVPKMLREIRPDLRIGFFNHIPFPPYEIFAQLPWRRQVLEGLLGADLLGFQRAADANNVLRACRRLGIATRRGLALVPDVAGVREVRCAAFPISVDAAELDRLARTDAVIARAKEIRYELGDPDLVLLGVDRLDYTKGILHRLKAIEELFDEGRLSTPHAVFVQVATPSRERVETYQEIRQEVEVVVGRINGLHGQIGHPAMHYLHQSFPREELAALYLVADVMLVTALRDGMNLVAKEYVASRHDEGGALVLSEFTGAAIQLTQAHLINPHDIDGVKQAIVHAVHTPPREAARRMRALRRQVFSHDVSRWAADFLSALGRPRWDVTPGPDPLHAALVDLAARESVLIACDVDGVLAPLVDHPDQARALPVSLVALERLAGLPGTAVVLVSGRALASLRQVAPVSEHIMLIGGHGAESATGDLLLDRAGPDAAQIARATQLAEALTAISVGVIGSKVERKPTSATLHTRGVPTSEAERAEREVLNGPAAWPGVRLLRGKDVLEVSVSSATKGTALRRLRERLAIPPGGVVYLGDDVTDEAAFAVLDQAAGDVAIKVGEGMSLAAHRLSGPEAVADVLSWVAGLRTGATSRSS
ncbi:MAG: trehalose-phosphatase [Kineosporiaceae bacterium]